MSSMATRSCSSTAVAVAAAPLVAEPAASWASSWSDAPPSAGSLVQLKVSSAGGVVSPAPGVPAGVGSVGSGVIGSVISMLLGRFGLHMVARTG
jgi:hypothetical protein